MTGAGGEDGGLDNTVLGERLEEDRDRWRLRLQILLGVLGVVVVLGLWWAIATGRMALPSPPLPLPL